MADPILNQNTDSPYGNNIIPTASLTPTTPLRLPNPTPDTTNHAGIISGVADNLQSNVDSLTARQDLLQKQTNDPNNTTSISNQILSLMGQENNKAQDTISANDTAGVTALNKQLNDLNAQAKNLNLESQAIPIQTQQNNANTGATDAGIAPQNAGALRNNALKALSLSQQANIAQGNLTAATAAAQRAIDLKYLPIENQITTLKQQYDFNKDALTAVDAKRTEALNALITKRANDVAAQKTRESNNVDQQVKWADNAYQAGQSDISSQISKLDPASPTFKDDLARLQSQVKLTPDQLYKIAQTNSLNGTPGNPAGAGTGAINVAQISGITDLTIPLTQAISNVGIDNIVAGIIKNEGGTPQGKNNPGNLKFANQPGATQGKAAPDGGFYADFGTLAEGKQAIANDIQAKANAGLSFQDAINKYTNTYAKQNAIGTTGSPTMDPTKVGYATNIVGGTGLTQSAIDKAALSYALTGTMPSVGLGSTGQAALKRNAIQNRAGEMDAGGNIQANKATLKSNTDALTTQTDYLNSVQRALTASEGGGQWLVNNAPAGINISSSTFANTKLNDLTKQFGNSDAIRKYQAALYEIGNEYAQVFARGGARSVEGNSAAQQLLSGNITMSALKGILDTLQSIGKINIDASQQQVQSIQDKINGIIGGVPGIKYPTSNNSFSVGGFDINIPTQ